MKLIKLEVEQFRKLTAVELDISGNVVEISGKNAAGKSSLLDAPWVLLKGLSQKDSIRPVPTQPIHAGAEQATIKGTFKGKDVGLIVTRTFKASERDPKGWTSKLEVTNLEGMTSRVPPQQQLDAIIGEHRLDPIEFINLDAKDQLKAFRAFIPEINFELIEEQNDLDYAKRTEVGRTVTRLGNAAAAISVPELTPDVEVDVNDLAAQLQQAGAHNTQIETRKAKRREVAAQIDSLRRNALDNNARIAELQKQIDGLHEMVLVSDKEAAALQAKLDAAEALPEPIPTILITQKIQDANVININVRNKITKQQHAKDAVAAQSEYDALTTAMDKRNADMDAAIKAAKLPLPNIGFGKTGLMLNNLPFKEASTAEQIRTAVALSMSLHPQLRLMWIRDASLLDDDSLATIYKLADEYDCNVLLETVRPQSSDAVVLEDGHVKDAILQPAPDNLTATQIKERGWTEPTITPGGITRISDDEGIENAIYPGHIPPTSDDDIL